jgi:hypothetical protein
MAFFRRVRGVRASLPSGSIIGRKSGGTGAAEIISAGDIVRAGSAAAPSPSPGGGSTGVGTDGQVWATVGSAAAWSFLSLLTKVGTIATGVWQGTKIALAYGGTNADLSATGGAHKFLRQNSVGAAVDVVQPDFSDLASTISTHLTAGTNISFSGTDPVTINASGGGSTTLAGDTDVNISSPSNNQVLTYQTSDNKWHNVSPGTGGTVTSVAMTVPAELSVAGSPVTTSGTLAVTWAAQADNKILANITGGSSVPSFSTVTAVLDHALGSTNDKLAIRRSGAWTQDQISNMLTAGVGIALTGTTNVTVSGAYVAGAGISISGATITNTGASGSPGGSSDYIAPIYGGGPPSIMRAFGEKSVDGGAGTGPAGSGPVGDITIQYNTPKQPGSFIGWDGARFVSTAIISQNTSGPPPTPLAGTVLQLVGKDSVATRLSIAGFATQGNITFQRANGTAASLSALTTADIIGGFGGAGYGATGYSSFQRAQVRFTAAEPWTDSAQGARIAFAVNKLGASSALEQVWIAPDGGLELLLDGVEPTGSTKGGGTVNAATYPSYYTNGNWEGGPVNQAPPASGSITIAASHSLIFVRKYTPPNNAKLILGSDAFLRGA